MELICRCGGALHLNRFESLSEAKNAPVGGCYDPGDLPPTSVPDAFERSRILPRANQVSTGHLIAPVCALVPPFRIPHPRQQKTAIRMGTAVIGVWMRDSIKLRSCRRPASGKQGSTGALHQIGSNPSPPQIKKADTRMGICFSWQRMRDSNPRERSQSPVCYRYTNPLSASSLYPSLGKCQALFSVSQGKGVFFSKSFRI